MPLQKYLKLQDYDRYGGNNTLKQRSVGEGVYIPYTSVQYAPFITPSANIILQNTFQYDNINFTSYFEFLGNKINIVNGNPNFNEIDGSIGNDYISIGSQLFSILNNSPNFKDYSFEFNINVNIIEIIIRIKGSGEQYSPNPFGQSPDIIDGYSTIFGINNVCWGQEIDFSSILVTYYQITNGVNNGAQPLSQTLFSKKYSIPQQDFTSLDNRFISTFGNTNYEKPMIFNISDFILNNMGIGFNFYEQNYDYKQQIKPRFILYAQFRDNVDGQLREYYDLDQEVPEVFIHNSSIRALNLRRYYTSRSDKPLTYILTGKYPLFGDGAFTYNTTYHNVRCFSFNTFNQTSFNIESVVELNDGTIQTFTQTRPLPYMKIYSYQGQITVYINILNRLLGVDSIYKNIKTITYNMYEMDTNGTSYGNLITTFKEIINHEYDNNYKDRKTIMFQNSYGGQDSYMSHLPINIEYNSKKDIFKNNINLDVNSFGDGIYYADEFSVAIIDDNIYGKYNNDITKKYKITFDVINNFELEYFCSEIIKSNKILLIEPPSIGSSANPIIEDELILDSNSLSITTNDIGQQITCTFLSKKHIKTINNING